MAELKYRFNPDTLNFERIRLSAWQRSKRIGLMLLPGLLVGLVCTFLVYQFLDSPKEANLRRENQQLLVQYELLNKQLGEYDNVLSDVRRRDDNIYRVIFEADPLPESMRQAGSGGVNRYKDLQGYASSDIVIDTKKRLDKLTRQLLVQSRSLDHVAELVLKKQDMLASIPAVQPINNKDLTMIASGYGMRIHPIHKIPKFHAGMDFTAKVGTPIYATGDGRVTFADYSTNGYGMHVIVDHGFDYETLYAHMSVLKVKNGQRLQRGDLLGFVGNSGLSSGPHLHYEVHKGSEAVDPANYYFNDLTPEEYTRLLEISRNAGQSYD
ncbi:MAG: M23 family metallopeptidase [Flavobacteriales bacterium]|nr:M23 family metallopeptidase [Flavobacteriales bacterium]MBP9139645.1 M23 family metallopeptidase [Flavobacteriales bacterium]HQV53775.1 M23 family metallopeptidase [Flavobacteriales bacterium]HQX31380.1 M23 family metallopeptidase [Flavobacteriales bacterium]HQX39892.1 M23 family metallopeptidase [Flavobacteriales bacterium]